MTEITLCQKYTIPEDSVIILHGKVVSYPSTDGDNSYIHCFFKNSKNNGTDRMIREEDFGKFPQELIDDE